MQVNNIIDKFLLKRSNSLTVSEKGFDIVSSSSTKISQHPDKGSQNNSDEFSKSIPNSFHGQYSYLNLKERVSQIWLNKWTLVLLLMVIKIFLFKRDLESSLNLSMNYTKQTCNSIEQYASTLVSLPHYLTEMTNQLLVKSFNELSEDRIKSLQMLVTIVENLIVFTIESIIGTYTCLITAAVDGIVDMSLNATESAVSIVNDTVIDLTDDIETGLNDISKVINKLLSAASSVEDFFTGDDDDDGSSDIKKVNLTINALRNISIPSSVLTSIDSLKSDIPDFSEVENATSSLIKYPFELIKQEIGSNLQNITASEIQPTSLETVLFCSNSTKIDDFYEKIGHTLQKTSDVIIILLVVAAFAMMIPIAWTEYRHWTKLSKMAIEIKNEMIDSDSFSDTDKDKLARVYEIMEHYDNKIPFYVGLIINKIKGSSDRNLKLRWLISYITSRHAVIFLGVGLAGIITVGLQFAMLQVLNISLSLISKEFQDGSEEITSKMGISLSNWTNNTNEFLALEETRINDDLFGWVQNATSVVNSTVYYFSDKLNSTIYDAFHGTLFYGPISSVVYCEIGRKLESVEEGLQWIHENAEFTLPRISDDLMNSTLSEISANSNSNSAVSKAANNIKDAFESIVEKYRKSLLLELYISLAILIVWICQILIGLLLLYFKNKIYSERDAGRGGIPLGFLSTSKLSVSAPKPLTEEEKKRYGYPTSDLYDRIFQERNFQERNFQERNFQERNLSPIAESPDDDPSKLAGPSIITPMDRDTEGYIRYSFTTSVDDSHNNKSNINNIPLESKLEDVHDEESPFSDKNRISVGSISKLLTPYFTNYGHNK